MVAVDTGSAVKPSSRRTQMSWFTAPVRAAIRGDQVDQLGRGHAAAPNAEEPEAGVVAGILEHPHGRSPGRARFRLASGHRASS